MTGNIGLSQGTFHAIHAKKINTFFFDGHSESLSALQFRDRMVNSDYKMKASQTFKYVEGTAELTL